MAARQRTLAERYVKEVLLARAGGTPIPPYVGRCSTQSARVLLDGGTAPAVNGDDDETHLSAATDRHPGTAQQERRLVRDLTRHGRGLRRRSPAERGAADGRTSS